VDSLFFLTYSGSSVMLEYGIAFLRADVYMKLRG
jgi:hypothetical protein